MVLNNSGGESLENQMQLISLDGFIRQFFKHSEHYQGDEPLIRIFDLNGNI
jgi:hypothetical protein